MAVRVNGKLRGESPEEQFIIEKKKFENREKRVKSKVVKPKTGQTYLFKKG